MTIAQKRAIGYAIRAKQQENMKEYRAKHNLMYDFRCSHYKTLRGYLKHVMNMMFLAGEDISEISEALR